MDGGVVMKRSEALKIIEDQYSKYVEDWLKLDIGDDEQISKFVKFDERILSALEEAGMLPPFSYLKALGVLDTAWEPEED
jgi:hypothetical protein